MGKASNYTDEDVRVAEDAVAAIYDDGQPHEHEDEIRAASDAVAGSIAARGRVAALRDLVRYCFDEHDAGFVVGGIETVECYVFDTMAALTGDERDIANAASMREIATESLRARVDEIEAGR